MKLISIVSLAITVIITFFVVTGLQDLFTDLVEKLNF